MNKVLITQPLNELSKTDIEGLGALFPRDGKTYRYVKNKCSTSLISGQGCIVGLTTVEDAALCRVLSPDGAAASTGLVTIPAGDPVTGIGPSGSDTGDHGWIQVQGIKTVRIMQMATALVGGCRAVATSVVPSTGSWGQGIMAPSATSAVTSYHYARGIEILQPLATTGAATCCSALVDIQCLP
jgi:hypothetical protein